MSLRMPSRVWLDDWMTACRRPLVVRQGTVADDAQHAEDAVHGGANLVAHGREELALRLIGLLGPFSRALSWLSTSICNRALASESWVVRSADQHLELALVPPQLRFRSLALPSRARA